MTALQLYALLNIGLLAAYAAFRLLRALDFLSAPPALASRISLALLALGLLAPAGLAIAPQKSLPQLPIAFREPLAEAGRTRKHVRARLPKLQPPSKPADPETRWTAPEISWALLERLLAATLAMGILVQLARGAAAWRRLRELIDGSATVRSLGQVRVRVSTDIDVPLSVRGLRSAEVLLPQALIARKLDTTIAIRHELQHHRQGDTLAALALELLRCIFFPNPAIHAWRRELADLQEFACDEAVLDRRRVSAHAYGSCLVRVAEAALAYKGRTIHAGTACMAQSFGNPVHFKSILRRRVEMLLKRPPTRRQAPAVISGTLAALAITAIALGAHQSLRGSEPEVRAPNPGRLEPVSEIQGIADRVLAKHVAKARARAGFIVVSDPASGRLLAVAQKGHSPENWALSYRFEPASIIKTIVAAAAVEQQATTLDEKHDCERGNYAFGSRVFHDWKDFTELTTAETVMHSSNICGIKIGEELGPSGLGKALVDFGFGPGGSAEHLPGARPGEFPAPGELARTDYIPLIATGYTGAGVFYVTPIEVVQAYGAIANGGVLMRPFTGASDTPRSIRRVLSTDTADEMRETLARAVEEGTGKNARSNLYTTAGKTSSAYARNLPENNKLGGEESIAGFVGFAPVENPKVLIYTILIDPKDKSARGNYHAAPIFHDTAEAVLKKLGVAPDRERP